MKTQSVFILAASLATATLLPAAPMDSTTLTDFDFSTEQQDRMQSLLDAGTLELQRVLTAPSTGYRHMGWPVATRLPDGRTVVLIRNTRNHSGYESYPDNARRIIYSDDNMATWHPSNVLATPPVLGVFTGSDATVQGTYDYSGMHAISWALPEGSSTPRLVAVTGKDDRDRAAGLPSEKVFRVYLSDDRGATWRESVGALANLPNIAVNAGPNMIQHPEYGLVVPFGQQTGSGGQNFIARSGNAGETWQVRVWANATAGSRIIEPALATWGPGHMVMIGRERNDYGFDENSGYHYYTQHVYRHTPGAPFSGVNFTTARTNIAGNGKTPADYNKSSQEAHDTAEIIHNPVTGRIEMIQSSRWGGAPGNVIPANPTNSLNLWSIDPVDLLNGSTAWRFEGTLVERQGIILGGAAVPGGNKDGFHPGGSIVDTAAGRQHIFIYVGIYTSYANAYRISRPLDTYAFREACGLSVLPKPTLATVGHIDTDNTITITGANLDTTKEVLIGGEAAPIVSFTATEIKFTIPAGKADGTEKEVVVRTNNGIAKTTATFTAHTPPVVTGVSFEPGSAIWAGNTITITGANLSTANKVFFGAIQVTTFISKTDTEIVVTVPPGITTGRVSVQGPGGTAYAPGSESGSFYAATKPSGLAPLIGRQPIVTGLRPVDFLASASGNPTPYFRWHYRTPDTTEWAAIPASSDYMGLDTAHLTIVNTAGKHNWQLRYAALNNTEPVYSSPVILQLLDDAIPAPAAIVAASGATGPDLYVADTQTHTIRKISQSDWLATTFAGQSGVPGNTGGDATATAQFRAPRGIAITPGGELVIVDTGNSLLRLVATDGTVITTATAFNQPRAAVADDITGDIYVADTGNHLIKKISPAGAITIIAGAGVPGNSDGIGTSVQFNRPSGLAIDVAGNLYIADTGNHCIRFYSASTGSVTLFAGRPNAAPGSANGAVNVATFRSPEGVTVDANGDVYVADTGNHLIREVRGGSIYTIAGQYPGIAGFKDGTGTNAWFASPTSITIAEDGNLYVADTGNAVIRRIDTGDAVTTLPVMLASAPPAPPPPGATTPPGTGGQGGGAPTWFFLAMLATLIAARSLLRERRSNHFRSFSLTIAIAFATTATAPDANAAQSIPGLTTSNTTYNLGSADYLVMEDGTDSIIADGARLVITRADANGRLFVAASGFNATSGARTTLNITGTNGGRVVFQGVDYARNDTQGSISALNDLTTLTTLNVTSVDFINNSSGGPPAGFPNAGTAAYNGLAGVFNFNKTSLTSTFTDVLFEGNWSWGEGGIARVQLGEVILNDSIVRGNYTRGSKNAGAFTFNSTGSFTMNGGLIEANRTASTGGVFALAAAANTTITLNNVVIRDNWAANTGGVFMNNMNTVNPHKIVINITAAGGTNSYLYSGNLAGNVPVNANNNSIEGWHMESTVVGDNMVNNIAPAAVAKRGGFYWGASANSRIEINIAPDHTLTIGTAATPDADTFAAVSGHTLRKLGAGDLILNANNAYWEGEVSVEAGRLLLGNTGAKLGGNITVFSGAVFGGSGTLVTYDQTDVLKTMSLTANAGSLIQIGSTGATPQTLTLLGDLSAGDGAIFRFDIFSGGQSDRFLVNGAVTQTSGTSIIEVNTLISGTYNLGNIAGLSWGGITVGGQSSAGSRLAGSLDTSANPGNLLLVVDADISRALMWTAGTGTWDINADNWAGSNSVTTFAPGDRVIFSGASDSTITLAGTGEVLVADMKVDGAGNHTFAGTAGINASVVNVNPGDGTDPDRITDATGKLVKTGAGTLTFANGANTFAGGIEIGDAGAAGGAIVFNNTSQLGVGADAAIHFINTGTLRAASSTVGGELAADIIIDAGKTAVLSTQGGVLSYSGALSGGPTAVFAQGGASDTLILTGNSNAYEGITNATGVMLLSGGTLGGTVNVAPGATFGGKGAATGANSVHAAAGSTILVGLPGGDGSEILSIANLQLADGAAITGHGTLSGTATIGAGAAASMNIDTGKTIMLAATLGGNGELVKTGDGTLDVTSGKLQAGTVTLRQGALRAGSGAINVNALNIGAGGVLKGAGTISIGPGGLTNAGSIKVGRAGGDAVHDTLTIDGSYNGIAGGSIELAFSNASQKDILNINGSVNGTTDVIITPLATIESAANLPTNLITVNGGITEIPADAFNVIINGILIGYDPYAFTYNPATGGWVQLDAPVPAVPALASLGASTFLIGKASLSSLSQRLAALRDNANPGSGQFWINGFYRNDKLDADIYRNATSDAAGMQIGADWTFSVNKTSTRLTLGVFYDYTNADLDMDGNTASTNTKSTAIGAYLRVRGAKWYADTVIRGGNLDYTITIPGQPGFGTSGDTWAASFEIGCTVAALTGWSIEPQVQLVYQSNFINDAINSNRFVYRANRADSLEGRAGVRAWRQFKLKNNNIVTPYARASLVHEFKGESELFVSDYVFANDLGGAAVMADAGVNVQFTRAVSMNAGASWLNGSKTSSYAFTLSAALAW